jgi:hypothetical protein
MRGWSPGRVVAGGVDLRQLGLGPPRPASRRAGGGPVSQGLYRLPTRPQGLQPVPAGLKLPSTPGWRRDSVRRKLFARSAAAPCDANAAAMILSKIKEEEMRYTRLAILCALIPVLGMSLAVPAIGAGDYCYYGFKGAMLQYEGGTCSWQCCSEKVGSASGVTVTQCSQLCAASCGGRCEALY